MNDDGRNQGCCCDVLLRAGGDVAATRGGIAAWCRRGFEALDGGLAASCFVS